MCNSKTTPVLAQNTHWYCQGKIDSVVHFVSPSSTQVRVKSLKSLTK